MATAKTLLELARSQLGVKESPPDSNRVKYNAAYYGREVSGEAYPWCCAFQWWLFREAGAEALFFGGEKTASCTALYNYYRGRGQAVEPSQAQPGDLVFFVFDGGKSGGMNHIGLCESVEAGYITTIDGNTGTTNEANGGAVMRRRRAMKYVGGVVRPAYTEEEEGMKIYHYVQDMPAWAQKAATKAIRGGVIKMDETGAVNVWECNLQPLVWMDRAGLLDKPATK